MLYNKKKIADKSYDSAIYDDVGDFFFPRKEYLHKRIQFILKGMTLKVSIYNKTKPNIQFASSHFRFHVA